jgi:hypothetical protein
VLKAQASSWQFDTLKRKEKLWSGFDEPKELGIEYWQLGVLIDCYRPLNFGPRCSLEFYYFQEVHMMRAQAANANKVEVQDQWSWGFTVVACCHALILNWRQKIIILLCVLLQANDLFPFSVKTLHMQSSKLASFDTKPNLPPYISASSLIPQPWAQMAGWIFILSFFMTWA